MLIFDICNEAKGVVNFPGDNQETLYFQSYIFDDSASHFYKQVFKFVSGKHDCRTSRSKTTEVVAEQSQKIKMYIKTTNFDHKLSLQERIQSLCIFLSSKSCLWFRAKKEVKLSKEGWLYPVNYQHSLYLMASKPIWFSSPSNHWSSHWSIL